MKKIIAFFLLSTLAYANPKLEILESYTVELPEISGMCWRNNPESKNANWS
ncbi:MAG: hypothetical protein U0T83_08395 [Bacteriovoracaceae bacterium]